MEKGIATPTTLSQQDQAITANTGGFSWSVALTVVSGILMLSALYVALVWAPPAANLTSPAEQFAQRIFYFHVPSAWMGFLAFIVAAVVSALYLITRREKWDVWALASVEVG